ncbi:MAG: hypothetical protein ACM3JD_12875 [Rudaea sp.]
MRLDPPRPGSRWLFAALVALLALPALAPLTYPGSFQTLNGLNAVYDVMGLHARLGTCCWAPDFARGLDLFRSDGILAYAAAEFPHLLGLGAFDAVKTVIALGLILSGLGMFALARSIFHSDAAGLLSAVVYIYFPYHLALVYVRGAFGEAAFWAIAPFALLAWGRLRAAPVPQPAHYIAAALAFALAVLSLPGLGLILAVATPLAFEIADRQSAARRGPDLRPAATIVAGSLIGLIPQLLASLQSQGGRSPAFVPAFVYPFQMLTASWGTQAPHGNYLDQFPFQIGLSALALALFALALVLQSGGPDSTSRSRVRRVVLAAVIAAAAVALLMTPYLAALWNLGLARLVEYPFQLLILIAVALSVAAGSIAVTDRRMASVPLLGALAVVPIFAVYGYLAPDYIDFSPVRPPLAVFNDDEVSLLDARIIRPVGILRHGATVDVEMEWQALRQVNHDYTVFVHAVDENGKSWGGEDSKPQGGAMPTLKWPVGHVISDTHTLKIDVGGPREGYRLEIGIYNTATGERAATETGATEVLLGADGQ